ncbi:HD-GYP domain-containing protein [Pseudoramibacter alactolyticus]|uniref:HD-GYP domain-containing protein n=1 Tax=Pseudoramibacter alactolyticus TaxID=113287 RepID=UPI003D7FB936
MKDAAKTLINIMNRLPKTSIWHNMETGQYMRVILRMLDMKHLEKSLMWEGLSPFDFHDIGKVLLPVELNDYRALYSDEQRLRAMAHVDYGQHVFSRMREQAPEAADFCFAAEQIALYHHECFDGSGYPDGLAGKEIPFWPGSARWPIPLPVCAAATGCSPGIPWSRVWTRSQNARALFLILTSSTFLLNTPGLNSSMN